MSLIEIASVKCDVEDGTPAHQQGCRMTRALDLLVAGERHAGCSAKVALHRTLAHPVDITFDCGIGGVAASDDANMRQAGDEVLRIVIARKFPGQPRKPE